MSKHENKRFLTKLEIENIISFIKPQKGIPQDSALIVVKHNKDKLYKQLKTQQIYPNMIPSLKEMLRKQYIQSLIQSGHCVGVIGAQSIGEKQTQSTLNSVDWYEKVLYIKDNKTYVESIGKMIDNLLEENKENVKHYQEKKTEYLELPEGYYIPSGDEDGFNKWRRIEAVTRHLPTGKLVMVRTQSGRIVTASQCKSFLVWDENEDKFIPKLGSEIKKGDILPTTKYLPKFKSDVVEKEQTDFEYISGYWIGKKSFKTGKIPKYCYNCSLSYIKGIIRGLYDTKYYGHIDLILENKKFISTIVFVTQSLRLIFGLQFLLTYFGIFGHISKTINGNGFLLSIKKSKTQNELDKFIKIFYDDTHIIDDDRDGQSKKYGHKHVYFDKIKYIKYVDSSHTHVYDFTVEKTRNFNLFNGLIIRDQERS